MSGQRRAAAGLSRRSGVPETHAFSCGIDMHAHAGEWRTQKARRVAGHQLGVISLAQKILRLRRSVLAPLKG